MKHSVTIIFATMLSLSLITILFVASTSARSINLLGPTIDVEATAHAIQLQNRQSEIKAAGQERLLMLQNQITQTQQDLDDLNRTMQSQTLQLETQLSTLQTKIEQRQDEIKITQEKITQMQQTSQADETAYQTKITRLQSEVEHTENELATAQAQLQVAYDELNKPQLQATALPADVEINLPAAAEDNLTNHSLDSANNHDNSSSQDSGGDGSSHDSGGDDHEHHDEGDD